MAVLLLALLLFNFSNIVHVSFTDEYDNLLGGSLINQGVLLYKDFFTNHGPVAYYLAAGIETFSEKNFFNFRVIYQLLIQSGEVLFVYYLLRKYGLKEAIAVTVFFIITAISANFFFGYLLVADNLAGIFLTAAYIMVFYHLFKNKIPTLASIFVVSLLCFLALLTSYTYIFVTIFLYIFLFLNYFSKSENRNNKKLLKIELIVFGPYLLLGLYLLITKSWSDFYFQTVTFNQTYYVYGEAAKAKDIFELAYLLTIKILSKYKDLIFSFNQFNLQFPFMPTLLLSNTILWLYLLLTKRIRLFLFSFLCVIYTNSRNEPFSPGPLDFHSSSYVFISLFNGVFALFNIWSMLKIKINLLIKTLFYSASFLFIIYSISFFQFFYDRWWGIMQDKLTSKQPLYQIHPVSYYSDLLIGKDDYNLIGPYDPESNFYSQAKSTSKYYYLMPAMDKVPIIRKELIDDINRNKPKIIVYHTEMNILGVEPGKDFIHFLRKDYINLEDLRTYHNLKYKPVLKFVATFRYDLERHFFIRRDNLDEILRKMDSLGYIEID